MTSLGRSEQQESVWKALDRFRIELPSWGFANTGTRFGKFAQPWGRDHDRGEVCGRRRGEPADGGKPDGCAACAVGYARMAWRMFLRSARWRRRKAYRRGLSIRTCFSRRSISTDRLRTRARRCARWRWSTCWSQVKDGGCSGFARCFALGGRWVELSRNAVDCKAYRLDGRGAWGNARGAGRRTSGC